MKTGVVSTSIMPLTNSIHRLPCNYRGRISGRRSTHARLTGARAISRSSFMNDGFPPLRLGVTGLGGYAAYVCDRVLAEADKDQVTVQLLAVCEPEPERFPRRVGD